MNHDPSQHYFEPKALGSRYSIGLIVLSAIAAYFLLSGHRAHFFGVLPFLLLLAYPLMHVFMHRGHAGGHARRTRRFPSSLPPARRGLPLHKKVGDAVQNQ